MTQASAPAPEFSRPMDVRQSDRRNVTLTASEAERAALARRFGIVRIDRLVAALELDRDGTTVSASGSLEADIVQSCAVSGEDLPVAVRETIGVRFVPQAQGHAPEEEIEIDSSACDEIEYAGTHFDLGEAVAQSLALLIDPFATGPQADEARRKAGIVEEGASGPFAALAALRKKD